jgi:two-component system LytT family response regulator
LNNSQLQRRDERRFALLQTLRSARNGGSDRLTRVPLKENGKISFLDVSEIEWINAQGNYVELHTRHGHHLLRETMDGIESKLDASKFVRLRRATIVQVDQIKSLQPLAKAEFEVILKSGRRFQSSRRYRRNLDVLLKS